jgi:hypothetical protein
MNASYRFDKLDIPCIAIISHLKRQVKDYLCRGDCRQAEQGSSERLAPFLSPEVERVYNLRQERVRAGVDEIAVLTRVG